jgi:hypothetical protein
MEIAQYLQDEARKILQYEVVSSLPCKLADTEFYVAKAEDDSIFTFGVIAHNGAEYKIGTKKP